MRKILTTIVLAASALTAQANPYYHHGHRGGYHGGGNWVAPLVIGGIAGYVLSRPQPVIVQQPTVVAPSGTVYTPMGSEAVYQYQNIYFADCSCYKQVLVKIQ
jgi:hypothetical protein